MHSNVDFYPLLIVTTLAVVVPIVLHRIPRVQVPIIVGELLAGIAVGPSGFGLIGPEIDPWLDFLKLFGFAYLMFISGLEIDFSVLRRGEAVSADVPAIVAPLVRTPLRAGIAGFVLTFVLSLAGAWLLAFGGLAGDAIVMALVLSTTSLGIVAPVLQERGLIRTTLGQYALVAAVVGDFATVTLASIYVVAYTKGFTSELLLVIVLLAAMLAALRLADVARRHPALQTLVGELSHATAQIDTRGALALAVVFIALAQLLGVEVILGAFLAGAIVSTLAADEGSRLRPKLHALGYGFFIPVFFIMVGVDFDLGALVDARHGGALVLALLALAFLVKFATALLYKPLLSWRETLAFGTLASARLSLIIAVAAIGREIGVIDAATQASIIVVAIVTVVVAPILFNRLMARQEPSGGRFFIVGSSPLARLLALRLDRKGEDVVVVTSNRHLRDEIRDMGLTVRNTVPDSRIETLEQAGIGAGDRLIALLEKDDDAFALGTEARRRFGIETVVAQVHQPQSVSRFRSAGIQAVDSSLSALVMLEGLALRKAVSGLMVAPGAPGEVAEVVIRNGHFVGRSLRTVPLPGDAIVALAQRDGELLLPRGNTRLARGDVLTLIGTADSLRDAVALLGRDP